MINEVLCIETHSYGPYVNLVLAGNIYNVKDIHRCDCGTICYNVGVPLPHAKAEMVCTCDKIVSKSECYHLAEFFVEIGTTDEHEQYQIEEHGTVQR